MVSKRQSLLGWLVVLVLVVFFPTIASAHGHGGSHGGGWGNHHGGWGNGGWHGSYRGSFRTYQPRFYAPRPFVRFNDWAPRIHVRLGHPAWRTGRWYYGWRSGTAGWWWGVNNSWYAYQAPVYPYPVQAPVESEPVDEAPVNYYCQSQGEYYPQLEQCPEEWQVVPAEPAPAP